MNPDDLEPIDLEPIDLEAVDPEHAGDDDRFDRDRVRNRGGRRVWFASIGALVVAAWAVIALTNGDKHPQTLPPTPTSVASPLPTSPAQVDRITTLAPRLWAGLRGIGSGRFAVVVDDRLYLLDVTSTEAETTLVPLPEGHVTIDDQNGSSLLASTFQQTLVSTVPVATRTLSVRDGVMRGVAPTQWWLGRGDGALRDDRTGMVSRVPSRLRAVAAIQGGFLALDAQSRWVVWSESRTTPVAPAGGQLLAAGVHAIAIQYACGGSSCPVYIGNPGLGRGDTSTLQLIPQFAAFSPDDTRLAVSSASGDVAVLDATSRRELTRTASPDAPVSSLPLTWTADSRTLLIVRESHVEIVRGSDGAVAAGIDQTYGLEQLVALP